MRRIPIEDVEPGMKVARTLYYQYGGIMVQSGATLDAGTIERLKGFGYASMYIHDPDTEDVYVNDFLDEKTRNKITQRVGSLFKDLREETHRRFKPQELYADSAQAVKERAESEKFRSILQRANIRDTFTADVEAMLENILSNRELCSCVGTIRTTNNHIFDHSIEVAIHAAIIAKRLGFPRTELREIVLGSLLHDVGYIFLPEDITQKKGELTAHEADILKQHVIFGYYFLKERKDVPLLSAHIAYQHHEQQDGRGFPRGLRGTNKVVMKKDALGAGAGMIHRYADLVAVPDYYDELVSSKSYRAGLPPDVAAAKVREASGSILNAEVVDAFLSYLPVFPMGSLVVVTDGEYTGWKGVVVGIAPADLARPLVRLLYDRSKKLEKPVEVDLREAVLPIRSVGP